jgi:hypothetical protein
LRQDPSGNAHLRLFRRNFLFPEFIISHPSEAPLHQAKNNFVSGIVSMVFTTELDLRAEEPLEN